MTFQLLLHTEKYMLQHFIHNDKVIHELKRVEHKLQCNILSEVILISVELPLSRFKCYIDP